MKPLLNISLILFAVLFLSCEKPEKTDLPKMEYVSYGGCKVSTGNWMDSFGVSEDGLEYFVFGGFDSDFIQGGTVNLPNERFHCLIAIYNQKVDRCYEYISDESVKEVWKCESGTVEYSATTDTLQNGEVKYNVNLIEGTFKNSQGNTASYSNKSISTNNINWVVL